MNPSDLMVPIDAELFEEWRKVFPAAFVLNCASATIHRADCHHFNLSAAKSYSPKWVCASLAPLQIMAESKGWGHSNCACID